MRTLKRQIGSFQKVGECLYRYSSNGVYYARIKSGGKEIRRSLETTDRELAKRELARFKDEQPQIDRSQGKLTLAELCDRFLKTIQHQKPKTIERKTLIVQRIKRDWPTGAQTQVGKIRPSDVDLWLARYQFGPASRNLHVATAKDLFAMATRDNAICRSPVDHLRSIKLDKPIRKTPTFEEFKMIVASIRSQQFNADVEESADFVEFIGLAGLGQAEAAALQYSDIDWERETITTFRHKTKSGFAMPLYPQLRELLCRRRALANAHPDAHVFRIGNAKKAIAHACQRLNLPRYSHRSFRRMFVTRAIERGVDVKVIAEWQGHRDGGKLILDTYSHVNRIHSQRMAQLMTDTDECCADGAENAGGSMTLAHVAPPVKVCDALGWFRYVRHLKDNWQCPGGLDYERFSSEFVLAVVPDGWIKPGYGPTAQGKQRKDIGKGHVAFLDMYTAGVFDSLAEARARKGKKIRFDRAVVDHFFRVSIGAIASNDSRFFPDFWQAVEHWRNCLENGEPLLMAANRRNVFMILTTLLEDGSPTFTVSQLRKLVNLKFKTTLTAKDVGKVVRRLGIRKPSSGT